jgi:putative NADH-flavin reductase
MKILVIGASRGIGLELVKLALAHGHDVTALLRDPTKLSVNNEQLRKIRGDALDSEDVAQAVAGQDAVCSCVGVGGLTSQPVSLFSRGARNLLAALESAPRTRLVVVTGVGAGDSRGHGGFFYDKIFQPLLLKPIYDDKDREEALIKASNANWLIVRPGLLTNGSRTGRYRVITDAKASVGGKISRADVADFILEEIERPSRFRETPALIY